MEGMKTPLLYRCCLPAVLLMAGTARGDMLLGGAGSARGGEALPTVMNPALSTTVHGSAVGGEASFAQVQRKIRLPGYDATETTTTSPGLPSWAFAMTRGRLGFSVANGLPPLPARDVSIRNTPFLILGQQEKIDIDARVTPKGSFTLGAGWKPLPRLSIGLSWSYLAADAAVQISSSDSGTVLANISGSMTSTRLLAGIHATTGRRFSMAAVLQILGENKLDLESDVSTGSALESGGGQPPLLSRGLLIGSRYRGRSFTLLTDITYRAADAGATRFSMVDLREKPLDNEDMLALRAGAIIRLSRTRSLLLGLDITPSAIGQGSQGEDGTTGYGQFDVGLNPLQESGPYRQASVGMQIRRYRKAPRRRGKRRKAPAAPLHWQVQTGLVYRYSSVGIDEDGEQPAAYLIRTLMVPVRLEWYFR